MKTIADFKRRMIVGAKVNSQLFFTNNAGEFVQQNDLKDRIVTHSQSNSFALTMPNGKSGWCDWPKREQFEVMDDNTVSITWENGRLIYTFITINELAN